jgi:hypothetical protein
MRAWNRFFFLEIMHYNTELMFFFSGGEPMDLKLTQVRLLVTAYEACFFFYRDTLGFSEGYGSEHEDYASFKTHDAVVAIYKRPLMAEVVGTMDLPVAVDSQDRVVLHFQVDSVDRPSSMRAKGWLSCRNRPTGPPDRVPPTSAIPTGR